MAEPIPHEDPEDDELEGDEPEGEEIPSPEGAAVFPLIPDELGVHPLFLGILHAYVFLEGSENHIVNGVAAEEGMQYLATYLQRLQGNDLRRVKEDLQTLIGFAKHEKWPKQQIRFLQDFLADNGVE